MPFVEGYFVNDESSESILHYAGIRIRVLGTGDLIPTLFSLDEIQSSELSPIAMSTTTYIQPTRLANFTSQRVKLRLETREIDEIFKINKIIIFNKPIYTSYPG